MSAPRLLYLATADARGHLMRAQLLTHALRARGAEVDVMTTSDDGVRFLAAFGIEAGVLSRKYAVEFDAQQNMQRGRTDGRVARYVFLPTRMARDLLRLRRLTRGHDLIVNDSFHPALLMLGAWPGRPRKVVHVYGASLRRALEDNFAGRAPGPLAALFKRMVSHCIERAWGRIEHDFALAGAHATAARSHHLPTPVALASAAPRTDGEPRAAVYLNPHFRDAALADAIERGLRHAGLAGHLVGEGFAGRPGWLPHDPDWVNTAAHSAVIVSAPGMAALSVALVYRKPIVLIVTDQPEQARNAERAAALGLQHRQVKWQGDGARFAAALAEAMASLVQVPAGAEPASTAPCGAQARLEAWADTLLSLARAG